MQYCKTSKTWHADWPPAHEKADKARRQQTLLAVSKVAEGWRLEVLEDLEDGISKALISQSWIIQ